MDNRHQRFLRHIPKKKLIFMLGDNLLILALLMLTTKLTNPDRLWLSLSSLLAIVIIWAVFICTFYLGNLYVPLLLSHQRIEVHAKLILAVLAGGGLTALLWVFFPDLNLGGGQLGLLMFLLIPSATLWRLAFEQVLIRFVKPVRVLIIGAGSAGTTITSILEMRSEFEVLGYLDDDPCKRTSVSLSHPVLGTISDISSSVDRYGPTLVVLAIIHERRGETIHSLLECKMKGIEICDMPSLYEELTNRIPVNHVCDSWFLYTPVRGVARNIYSLRVKRLLDISLSFISLVLAIPVTVLAALAIVMETGFPVLYKQTRVGYNERKFWLVKFRSMRIGAESDTGAVWAIPSDPRVTVVGRYIRLFRIDEIPQLWNVLKGEMSFIGPRPERPEFVKELKDKIPYYSLRHTIKPGITGWAQVNYPYGASEEDAFEKLQYDLYYLKNMSALLDIHILLRTVRVVLSGQGSR